MKFVSKFLLLFLKQMITCILNGPLEDQLFQIFAVISYAMRNNDKCFFILSNKVSSGHPTYWDSLFYKIAMINKLPYTLHFSRIFLKEQNKENYQPLPNLSVHLERSRFICEMVGCFRHFRFFEDQFDFIYRKIDFKGQFEKLFLSLYTHLTLPTSDLV